jgi:hypothetical protein
MYDRYQPQIDAFIASLPSDQCHLVVNLKGNPCTDCVLEDNGEAFFLKVRKLHPLSTKRDVTH